MHLNLYNSKTPGLKQLPNLFFLYNTIEQTITYNGRLFNRYKNTKISKEKKYKLFRCKTYRHNESKLKGKPKLRHNQII